MKLKNLKSFLAESPLLDSFGTMFRRHLSVAIGAYVEKYGKEISYESMAKAILAMCVLKEHVEYDFVKTVLLSFHDKLIYEYPTDKKILRERNLRDPLFFISSIIENPSEISQVVISKGNGEIITKYKNGTTDYHLIGVNDLRPPVSINIVLSQQFFIIVKNLMTSYSE